MNEIGCGTIRDRKEAVKWFRMAAEQNYGKAQAKLGVIYESGFGNQRNDVEAEKWFRKAAANGVVEAQYCLGSILYRRRRGSNRLEAVEWLRKAAEQGHSGAQHVLAALCASGQLVDKDLVLAYVWLSLAAERGEPSVQALLEKIEKEMTSEEIANAKLKVREWRSSRAAEAAAAGETEGSISE